MVFWRRRRPTQRLYEFVLAQARQPRFYGPAAAPDTVDGRFEMLALHLWLVVRRLNAEGQKGQGAAQDLFDVFVSDMDANLRELGAADARFGKKMRNIVAAFYGRTKSYSEAMDSTDSDALRETLRRNMSEAGVAETALDGLAAYCRNVAAHLANMDFDAMFSDASPFRDADGGVQAG